MSGINRIKTKIPHGSGMNIVVRKKDSGHRYVFLYDDDGIVEAMNQLGEMAGDLEAEFTWYDAAIMSKTMQELRRRVSEGGLGP